jgi:hypothetical protein
LEQQRNLARENVLSLHGVSEREFIKKDIESYDTTIAEALKDIK